MALSEPLEGEPLVRNSYRAQSQVVSSSSSDTESELESVSDLTPPHTSKSVDARPISDGVATGGSDGDESLYQSLDEENSPDDQVCSFD